jgi:hypothetical protein
MPVKNIVPRLSRKTLLLVLFWLVVEDVSLLVSVAVTRGFVHNILPRVKQVCVLESESKCDVQRRAEADRPDIAEIIVSSCCAGVAHTKPTIAFRLTTVFGF